ncbi:hypothetical protein BDB00DRAFT_835164 [Zychaea mexicana]|uniref:uncharacterized protein n=1 Tax=Zychaea mexicana TaxID=64656 RepID=UPI0022FE53F9|nr:uncharacterized protein BDB00DRAFT_835164 [Zychaea mexicana]KAI9490937.1 hypothetical protein BDB00DRAFT_835164 [Zychaea mexicana]
MEPPQQDPQLESLDGDGTMSLHSSTNSSPPEQTEDAMDLFLNQVTDYNSRHLSYDSHPSNHRHHRSVLDPSSVLMSHDQHKIDPTTSHSMTQLPMNDQELMELSATANDETKSIQQQQESMANTNAKTTKGKEGGFVSAFANPLLHAIPILARNCLNFEDFLAQAALHGQNGLLGPKLQKSEDGSSSDYAAPDKLLLDPTKESSIMLPGSKIASPYHIRVLGLPETGAKSRVETQIKVCVQLINSTTNELATDWTHVRLPEHMVAKEKLKRKHQKGATTTTTAAAASSGDDNSALDESKLLRLEAAVVCDSHPDNEIIMCTSCVHRERKRLKRKRDNKVARAAKKEASAAKLAALFANDLPDLNDEDVMAQERRKILLFNCSEYVEFHDGEATLPTRVTCYCRHHSEKTGFRLVFTVKDSHNHVIATGRSPPIMITDDHKSSKVQQQQQQQQQSTTARKRTRTEFDNSSSTAEAPSNSKKKANNAAGDGETDSGVSSPSPMVSTPPTPTSQTDEIPASPNNSSVSKYAITTATTAATTPAAAAATSTTPATPSMTDSLHLEQLPPTTTTTATATATPTITTSSSTGSQSFLSHMHHYSDTVPEIPQGELFDFLNSEDISVDQLISSSSSSAIAPTSATVVPHNHQRGQQHQILTGRASSATPSTSTAMTERPLPQLPPSTSHRRRTLATGMTCAQQQWQASNMYAKMQQKNAVERSRTNGPNLPRLHRLIPSEGPVYGGSEVTVLGANFYEGLTCLFGENPAVPTHCWSSNTLLCILPPAASAGPVVVSFKEHPLMLEGQDVVLFTYFDESDRALMELALQVVGLKTMGKVEDARQIAMRIVQGDSANKDSSSSLTALTTTNGNQRSATLKGLRIEYRDMLSLKGAMAVYDNARTLCIGRLEEQVISALVAAMHMNCTAYMNELSLTNRNQHSLLHLATICGYDRLVKTLVKLGCDVDQSDHNGFTALHFASWTGKVDIVQALIAKANLDARNIMGKTPEKMALEAGHKHVLELFKRLPNRRQRRQKKRKQGDGDDKDDVRIPLSEFIPSDAVETARAVLPTRLNNMLSTFYTISVNTACVKNLGVAVGQVYNFMLDPF